MRLIMMGTGPFAVPTFEFLLASSHDVLTLVTRPATVVQSRGKSKAISHPMREVAESRGLPVLDPEDINAPSARAQLSELRPDLLVVCDYGQLLSVDTLAIAPLGGINLHGSLLPKYRGAAPVNWAIWRGESETGVTVLHMTPRLDAGPSLVQVRTAIGPDETAAQLEVRLAQLGVAAVGDALGKLANWDRQSPLGTTQDPAQATRAPRLKKGDGRVDWSQAAVEIYRQYRALQPWPGIYTEWQSAGREPLRIILEKICIEPSPSPEPGRVVVSDGSSLVVSAGRDAIAIQRLQPAGRRAMETAEFLRGYPLHIGERLGG
jgi:methionyl-tRNA formyltransferase